MPLLPDPTYAGNAPGDGPLRPGGMAVSDPLPEQDLPSTLSPCAAIQQGSLALVRDLWGGTDSVRAKTTQYLPKHPGEEWDDYNVRLAFSVFFNAFRRTVEGLCGLAFRKDPVLGDDVPPQIRGTETEGGHWENIDLAGTHGDVFLHKLMVDAETAGHGAILVEYPKTPAANGASLTRADEAPLRPYWVPIRKDDIVSWRTTNEDGRLVLTQLVLRERTMEPSGRFGEKEVERYRVFMRDETGVHFELLEITKQRTINVVDEGRYPTQDEIPVAEIVTSGEVGMFHSDPPLADVAHLNVAHYQGWSDYRYSSHKTCVPIFFASGVPNVDPNGEPVQLVLGPNSAIVTPADGASAMYVSHDGASLNQVRTLLEDLKNDMGTLGLAMLAPQKRAAETVEAKRLDKATSDSALSVTVRGLQDAAERALGFHARYLGLDSGGSITLNRDFEGLLMDAPVMGAFATLVQAGFPPRPVLEALQAGGRIAEDADLDELEMDWLVGVQAKRDAEEAAREAFAGGDDTMGGNGDESVPAAEADAKAA